MFCVGKAPNNKSDLHVALWILQKLEVFNSSSGLAQLQLDMRTRQYFLILTSIIFEGATFKARRHDNLRRRRRNKMNQGQRSNAYNPNNGHQFEYSPTSEFHSESLPMPMFRGNADRTRSGVKSSRKNLAR